MKRLLFVLLAAALLVIAPAFVSVEEEQSSQSDPTIYKLMEVTFLWNLLHHEYEPNRERDDTWLDVGFRSKYAMAKQYASLATIEGIFGSPVFVRGPHGDDMNFSSTTSFGYYNLEFISKLKSSVEVALEVPTFNYAIKEVYNEHFRSMALSYQDAYHYLNNDPKRLAKLKTEYLMQLAQPEGTTNGSMQEVFRDYADNGRFINDADKRAYEIKNPDADWYEKVTAPSFWLRRSIDGTSEQIYELLEMVIVEMEK